MIIANILLLSCEKNIIKPVDINTYDAIIGKWEKVSRLMPSGDYMPERDGSSYEFKKDMTFVKITTQTRQGSFLYDNIKRMARCNFSATEYELIKITFIDSMNAEFYIVGSETIKVTKANGT